MDYGARSRRVRLDLRRGGPGGERDEQDRVAGVEGAVGGGGDDVITSGPAGGLLLGGRGEDRLTGSARADAIDGGPGDDVVRGRGGDDKLRSGGGDDTVDAGGGDDAIVSGRGAKAIRCGGGIDRATALASTNRVAPRCERLGLGAGPRDDIESRLPLRDLEASLMTVRTFPACRRPGRFCPTVVTVRTLAGRGMRAGVVVARRRIFGIAAGVALSPGGRRLLRRARVTRVQVTLSGPDGSRGGYRTMLRAPRR